MSVVAYKALIWEPFHEPGLTAEEQARILAALRAVLESWEGTQYAAGQCAKQSGVDCTRFVGAICDELRGDERTSYDALPHDAAMHDRVGAERTMRELLRLYAPLVKVAGGVCQPGDFVITGPAGGGPGHSMIAGWRRGELWQTNSREVTRSGLALNSQLQVVHGVYRDLRRGDWRRWE